MKWLKRMISVFGRRRKAGNVQAARARALRARAEVKQAQTEGLRPQSERARQDLEELVRQALRGRE